MVEVDASTERRDEVTYVWATVHNTHSTPQRVVLANRLGGETWPPRHGTVTDPNWNDETWTGVVPANSNRGMGFATPAESNETPIEVVSAERVEDTAVDDDPDEVLASLQDWAPPNDILR